MPIDDKTVVDYNPLKAETYFQVQCGKCRNSFSHREKVFIAPDDTHYCARCVAGTISETVPDLLNKSFFGPSELVEDKVASEPEVQEGAISPEPPAAGEPEPNYEGLAPPDATFPGQPDPTPPLELKRPMPADPGVDDRMEPAQVLGPNPDTPSTEIGAPSEKADPEELPVDEPPEDGQPGSELDNVPGGEAVTPESVVEPKVSVEEVGEM